MNKKVVFITGCSTGIGRALSEEFRRCGFRVIATARRLESLSDFREKGISTHALDVNNKDQVKQVIEAVLHQEKTIDVLVNNAGYGLIGPSIEIPENELILQFQTNVFAALFIAQKIAPIMREHGNGLIINIGSVSGIATTPFSGAYCASKAALHALSDALRMELSGFGIKVVTVQPGGIRTHFGESAKATVSRVFKPGSWYQTVGDSIRSRAEVSQVDATPVDEFARKLVKAVMVEKPPAIIRIGKKSSIIPLLKKLVPTSILDEIFKKKFGLIGMKWFEYPENSKPFWISHNHCIHIDEKGWRLLPQWCRVFGHIKLKSLLLWSKSKSDEIYGCHFEFIKMFDELIT